MEAEVEALEVQLRRETKCAKTKERKSKLKTMLVVFWVLGVLSAHVRGKLKGKDVMC